MNDFLKELSEKCPSLHENYDEELFRSIFREIYRNGNISIRQLSYTLYLPLSEITIIINYLTEKKILSRVDQGILFTENGMQFIEKELGFYGYGIEECEVCEGAPNFISERWNPIIELLDEMVEEKDLMINVDSLMLKSIYLYDQGAIEGKDTCFLYNSSLIALTLSKFHLAFFPEEPELMAKSFVINQFDKEISSIVKEYTEENNKQMEFHDWNIADPVPDKMKGKFDTLITDFPNDSSNSKIHEKFLSRCTSLLKKERGKHVYLFLNSNLSKHLMSIQSHAIKLGYSVISIQKNLDSFFYLDPAFEINSKMLMVLESTRAIYEEFPSDEKIELKLMERKEIQEEIFVFWCPNCQKTILISSGNDDMKGNGEEENAITEQVDVTKCPYCNEMIQLKPDEIDEEEEPSEIFIEDFENEENLNEDFDDEENGEE